MIVLLTSASARRKKKPDHPAGLEIVLRRRDMFINAFEPTEARRLNEKLEIHLTPKHGSRLNMAEIELSVLSRHCLNDCLATREQLVAAVAPWKHSRNESGTGIDWRFTTVDDFHCECNVLCSQTAGRLRLQEK